MAALVCHYKDMENVRTQTTIKTDDGYAISDGEREIRISWTGSVWQVATYAKAPFGLGDLLSLANYGPEGYIPR